MDTQKIITGAAGALLLGVAGWILNTTLDVQKEVIAIQKDVESVQETLDKVYEEDCPYCVHAAHTGIQDHPLLAPTIKRAHKHLKDGSVEFLDD
jgi:hypothetical protein